MKMAEKRPLDDQEMDLFFEAAREAAPRPSDDLMARILADAAQVQTEAQALKEAVPAGGGGGFLDRVFGAVGGWIPATGLAAVAVTGLMIGFVSPDGLDDLTGGYLSAALGYEVDDLLPSFGTVLGEG